MSGRRFDPACLRLMLVTDRPMAQGRSLVEVVAAAVAGGVTSVQLREKTADTRRFVELARDLDALLRPLGVPLWINDRIDVALAAGIDHVHVGQSDMTPADVRRLMGPTAVIGLSITRPEELVTEDLARVDCLGVGPVFATATKSDAAPALGLDELAAIRRAGGLPVVAIGGIGPAEIAAVRATGVEGVAVVSAIMAAADPRAAARALAGA